MAAENQPPLQTLQQAMQLLQSGNFALATELCQTICATPSPSPDAFHLLAIIFAQSQQLELAQSYFLKAIQLAPQRADYYGNYANMLWEIGEVEATIEHCQQAIALHSQRPEVYNTLGNALFRQSKFSEASRAYQQAINLQSNYAEAHNNLGQALKTLKDYTGAEQCFQQALKLRPEFALAAENLEQVNTVWLTPVYGKQVALLRSDHLDAPFLHATYQNREFMYLYNRFMPLLPLETLQQNLAKEQALHPTQVKAINWIIRNQTTQKPIGIANLVEIQLTHRRAEFLIGIPDNADRHSGSGIEATLLVMDFVFNQIQFNKLTTFVYSDNIASIKNNIALGFRRESYLVQHLRDTNLKHYIDLCGNAMTADEFRQNTRLAKLSLRLLKRDITKF